MSNGLTPIDNFVYNNFMERVDYLNGSGPPPEKRTSADFPPLREVGRRAAQVAELRAERADVKFRPVTGHSVKQASVKRGTGGFLRHRIDRAARSDHIAPGDRLPPAYSSPWSQ
jgi:hypothetical protein